MPMADETTKIRVTVWGREYPLRVALSDEGLIRAAAALADERLTQLRKAHPTQPDSVVGTLAALELAQELLTERRSGSEREARTANALQSLDLHLAAAMSRAQRAGDD
jgi:cell division protein ZapA (FtsZ GTPase activity inhibitor)